MANSYTDVFSNHLILPSINPYLPINLTSNVILAWSNDFGNNSNVVSNIMDITPNNNGYKVVMPNAMFAGLGSSFSVMNPTAFTFEIVGNDGVTTITTIAATSFTTIYLIDNTTSINGGWRVVNAFGSPSITSIGLNSATNGNIIVDTSTTNPITSSGTFTLKLGNDLLALTNFGTAVGYSTHIGANTWALRKMVSSSSNQVTIVNGDGVTNDTTFALNPLMIGPSQLTQLQVANIEIGVVDQNTISSAASNPNGNIILAPNGTGEVVSTKHFVIETGHLLILTDNTGVESIGMYSNNVVATYNLQLPSTPATVGQVLRAQTITPPNIALGWASVPTVPGSTTTNAIAIYANTGGALADSKATITNAVTAGSTATGLVNNLGNITSIGVGNLLLGGTGTAANTIEAVGAMYLQSTSSADVVATGGIALGYTPGAAGSTYVGFKSPAAAPLSTIKWALPATDGTSGQVMATDGAQTLNWVSAVQFSGAASSDNEVAVFTATANEVKKSPVTIDAVGVIEMPNAATPTNTAGKVEIYAFDIGGGNNTFGFVTEGTPVSNLVTAADKNIAIKVNGIVYYLAAKTTV